MLAGQWDERDRKEKTYNASTVTATEVPVAVGSSTGAVGAALVTAVSGTAGVAGFEDRAGRDGGGEEGSEEDGELHFDCRKRFLELGSLIV